MRLCLRTISKAEIAKSQNILTLNLMHTHTPFFINEILFTILFFSTVLFPFISHLPHAPRPLTASSLPYPSCDINGLTVSSLLSMLHQVPTWSLVRISCEPYPGVKVSLHKGFSSLTSPESSQAIPLPERPCPLTSHHQHMRAPSFVSSFSTLVTLCSFSPPDDICAPLCYISWLIESLNVSPPVFYLFRFPLVWTAFTSTLSFFYWVSWIHFAIDWRHILYILDTCSENKVF